MSSTCIHPSVGFNVMKRLTIAKTVLEVIRHTHSIVELLHGGHDSNSVALVALRKFWRLAVVGRHEPDLLFTAT
jgi:hypothetical protein